MNAPLTTPVAFLVFNRPDTTARVFEAIREARPQQLFVIADGPRSSKPGEAERCRTVRDIVQRIDWPCDARFDLSEVNLGCGRRVSSGISAVFKQVEEAIFLEDDCLPDPTFFRYCAELLDRYRGDSRVSMISGTNEFLEWHADRASYHFTRYGSIWGWASWRRAWDLYDFAMSSWGGPEARARLANVLTDPSQFRHRAAICDRVFRGEVDTWDYQWSYARLLHDTFTVVPARNLISNLGFGAEATHTQKAFSGGASLHRYATSFPLQHPDRVTADSDYDRAWFGRQVGDLPVPLVVNQAEKLLAAGRHVQALIALDSALRADSGHGAEHRSRILCLRAEALAGCGHADRARAVLAEILAEHPDDARAATLRCRLDGDPDA